MARRSGVPDKVIMEIAGWKTHAMLLRYLGEAQESNQRAAFESMDAALSQAKLRQSCTILGQKGGLLDFPSPTVSVLK